MLMSRNPGGEPGLWKRLFTLRSRLSRPTEIGLGVLAFVFLLAVWAIVVATSSIKPQYMPSLLSIGEALYSLFVDFNFAADIYISVVRVAIAFAIAAVMAIPIGILMGSYRVFGALGEPVIDLIRYLPVPALVPLTVIWLGIGEGSKIALLWMGTFFQLVLLIADDAKRVPQEYVETAYTLGAKQRHVLGLVILRSILPTMVDNLRITLGWCWSYVILAEIVASNEGIGQVIWASRRFGKTPEVMAGVLTIGLIGLLSDQLIRLASKKLFPYLR
jgi:NitT/TauT family transport system permease protein